MPESDSEFYRINKLLEHQERTLDLMGIGSWEWDRIHDQTYWSKGLFKMLGVDPALHEPTLQGYLSVVHAEDRERVAGLVMHGVESRAPLDYEMRVRRPDGVVHILRAKGTPLIEPDGGIFLGYLGTLQDITYGRAQEEELRKAERMASIGLLAGGLAHHFGNLLTAITGHLSFLQADLREDPEVHGDLNGIARAVDRAAALVSQLLVYSGRSLQVAEPIDVNRTLEALESKVRELVGEDIHVSVHLDPVVPAVPITRGQLEGVILRLARAARDAMPDGGRLEIRTERISSLAGRDRGSPEAGGSRAQRVRVSVRDTGQGYSREELKRLADPFFTSGDWSPDVDLGLATVYGIARGCGGYVEVDSTPGEGTSFDVYLPAGERPAGVPLGAETNRPTTEEPRPWPEAS